LRERKHDVPDWTKAQYTKAQMRKGPIHVAKHEIITQGKDNRVLCST
ncbi:hypothetical protein A2U01_0064226, partial [Trifolium medium]|nr:hypothetical protein [Trifolium medium]